MYARLHGLRSTCTVYIEGRNMKQPTWKQQKPATYAPAARFILRDLGKLHAVMQSRGFTSGYQLARASNVHTSTVNHLVHNHRKTASAATVRQLREVLGEQIDEIFVLEKSQVHANPAQAA